MSGSSPTMSECFARRETQSRRQGASRRSEWLRQVGAATRVMLVLPSHATSRREGGAARAEDVVPHVTNAHVARRLCKHERTVLSHAPRVAFHHREARTDERCQVGL